MTSMSAELKPIQTRALVRPRYVHRELLGVDRGTWVLLNIGALERRYRALGPVVPFDENDFRRFCFSQYDAECVQRERFKREFGSSYDREPRYRP